MKMWIWVVKPNQHKSLREYSLQIMSNHRAIDKNIDQVPSFIDYKSSEEKLYPC